MEDVENGLQVVRTLLKLGHFQRAADAFEDDLANALIHNLEAHAEILSVVRPFFPMGWDCLSMEVDPATALHLRTAAAIALGESGEKKQAFIISSSQISSIVSGQGLHPAIRACELILVIRNLAFEFYNNGRFAAGSQLLCTHYELASMLAPNQEFDIFDNLFLRFAYQCKLGQWSAAVETWRRLDPMGRKWSRDAYRQGNAEFMFAEAQF
jgi:hypothetical protein